MYFNEIIKYIKDYENSYEMLLLMFQIENYNLNYPANINENINSITVLIY